MAYIQREGGDRFVIPSYRDVISKRKGRLKADILELSSKYGEFMTFYRRGLAQFDVAFASEAGYLFGECVWTYFKRPIDLIYCEVIPDTTDAYLVIVKDNGVYLDGVFPLDTIPEELVVFTTQKNNFEIYTYGEVNISQEPAEGKFSLEASSVKSFTVLEKSLFQKLPTVRAYQLQLVDVVLRQQGIGVFPTKYVVVILMLIGLAYMGYSFVTVEKKKIRTIIIEPAPKNPYFDYNKILATPAPDAEIRNLCDSLMQLYTLPGWTANDLNYTSGTLNVNVTSGGANTEVLYDWAAGNGATVNLNPRGFSLSFKLALPPDRNLPRKVYPLDRVISNMVDRMALIASGEVLGVGPIKTDKSYKEVTLMITLNEVSPETILLIAEQLKDLPLVLTNVSIRLNDALSGVITLKAYGI